MPVRATSTTNPSLNVPAPLSQPRPRILIGGSGEKKTLRLVAKYADACNIFGMAGPGFVGQRLGVLRDHCEREGRNYDDIEKAVLTVVNPGPNGENAGQLVDQFKAFGEAGVQTVIGSVGGVEKIAPLEAIGRDVIPQIAQL